MSTYIFLAKIIINKLFLLYKTKFIIKKRFSTSKLHFRYMLNNLYYGIIKSIEMKKHQMFDDKTMSCFNK